MEDSKISLPDISSPMANFEINEGDLVRIVAPGGKGDPGNLPLIKSYVESLGLIAEISDNIYKPDEPFYSNSDEFRANDLISSILNDNCKVIWCIRGGSGCNRLIRYLDEGLPISTDNKPPLPKLLVGYSDITVLHIYLQKKYNWQTVHGAMLEAIVSGFYDRSSETVSLLEDIILRPGIPTTICYSELTRLDEGEPLTHPIEASIVGGNLTLVEASIGTAWEIDISSKIIFLEDISVAAYSIERSLEHLKQAGIFNRAQAVVFGDFTDADSQRLIRLVEQRFATDSLIKCPVFVVEGIGHGKVNLPLPLNSGAGEIKIVEPGQTYQLCAAISR